MVDARPERSQIEDAVNMGALDWPTVPQNDRVTAALTAGTLADVEFRVIQVYLGSANRASVSRQHYALFARVHCAALAAYLRETGCRIEGAANIVERPHRLHVGPLALTSIETGAGRREPVPERGLIFIQGSSGERFVLKIETEYVGPQQFGVSVTVIDAHGRGERFLDDWEEFAIKNAYLRGKAFYPDGELVTIDPAVRPSDVLLPADVRRMVDRLILSFPEQVRRFRGRGLSAKRGVILEGPPGSGKTMLCRALCGHLDCTFVWLTSRHLAEDPGTIAQAWRLARLLKPTIILLEDLDLVAESRESSFHGFHLGELMNQMDGVEENDGILTIATTNRLEIIEKAVRNRPGRFDHAIHLGEMDDAARRTLLDRHLGSDQLEAGVLESLARWTSGCTGARLVEVIKSLIERASEGACGGNDGRLRICLNLAEEVLREANPATERRPAGFLAEQTSSARPASQPTVLPQSA